MNSENSNAKKPTCGIIMPISAIDGCSEEHWKEVLNIVSGVIESIGFEPNLVSNADDVGVIQKRIVQNIQENPIIVCDVSGKNPNVMFELGMRLAFDQPTIIIKDDKTSYSFDTSLIEHIIYPRDLRFTKIREFEKVLKEKILGTTQSATSNSTYTTFLKNFVGFNVDKSNLNVPHSRDKSLVANSNYIAVYLEDNDKTIELSHNNCNLDIRDSVISGEMQTPKSLSRKWRIQGSIKNYKESNSKYITMEYFDVSNKESIGTIFLKKVSGTQDYKGILVGRDRDNDCFFTSPYVLSSNENTDEVKEKYKYWLEKKNFGWYRFSDMSVEKVVPS